MDPSKKKKIEKTPLDIEHTTVITGKGSNVLNKHTLHSENVLVEDPAKVVLSLSQRRRLRKKKSLQKKQQIPLQNLKDNIDESSTNFTDKASPPVKLNIVNKVPGNETEIKHLKENKSPTRTLKTYVSSTEIQPKPNTDTLLNTAHVIVSKVQDLTTASKNCEETATMAQKSPKTKNITNVPSRDETDFVSSIKLEKVSNVKGLVETDKSRDQIKAEREAKKLAKQLAKTKVKAEPSVLPDKKLQPVIEKSSELPKVENIPTNDQKDAIIKKISLQTTVTQIKNVEQKQEKSKSELKAERRAIQEAQRAAKVQGDTTKKNTTSNQKINIDIGDVTPKPMTTAIQKIIIKDKKLRSPKKFETKLITSQHKVKLFNHLYPEREVTSAVPFIPLNSGDIHPAVIRLGVQYASRIVMGSNARCIALLNTLKQVVEDYTLPANVEFSRGFEAHLAPCLTFLNSCRPPAVSMNNALKHIKWQLTQLPNNIEETDAKNKLQIAIDTYVDDQIRKAGEAITIAVNNKISNGDVILTYGCSSLVENILKTAAKTKCFKVVVIEAHPWNEGKEMLRRLTAKNIKCSLVMISALSFVMREINKVVLGAGALLANGYVMARAGTAQVAMVAHAHNVPVLVCCEIHKFSERVQTDSFVYNEIGNPDDLIKCDPLHQDSPLSNWRSFKNLTPLNLTYDVTPPDLVTAVVTELAILPCTSVPVILRIKPSEF